MIKEILKKQWRLIVGIAVGMLGGYLYWFYIGCESGGCPITSSPVNSTLWGAAMGGLFSDIFRIKKKKVNNKVRK